VAGEPITVDMRAATQALHDIADKLPDELKAAGREAAEPVATTAKTLAPHDTGRLAATIRTGATRRSATVKAGGRRAPGTPLIHFGAVRDARTGRRRNISPQPFLYRALDSRRDEVLDAYTRSIERLLDREG
jgi:Bacteriophage HK97-gp10, putative tail-component